MSLMSAGPIYYMIQTDSDWKTALFYCVGKPLPWYCHVKDSEPVGTIYYYQIFGHTFQIEYADQTDISYLVLVIDIAFWLLLILLIGALFEWRARKFRSKATSTKP